MDATLQRATCLPERSKALVPAIHVHLHELQTNVEIDIPRGNRQVTKSSVGAPSFCTCGVFRFQTSELGDLALVSGARDWDNWKAPGAKRPMRSMLTLAQGRQGFNVLQVTTLGRA